MSVYRLLSDLINDGRTRMSFTLLRDVSDNLAQMATEPGVYLHVGIVPSSGARLDFGSRLPGRREEVSQLMDIANDIFSGRGSRTGPLEIVSVGGYPVSGKSFPIRRVGGYLSKKGWMFVQGKFNRIRMPEAFGAVTLAFGGFCDALLAMRAGGDRANAEYCSKVSAAVMSSTMGSAGVEYLGQLIPGLARVITCSDLAGSSDSKVSAARSSATGTDRSFGPTLVQTANEAVMSQRRRENLLCSFVEAVLGMGRPVLLFYEDVQWANAVSLKFLRKLLKPLEGPELVKRQDLVLGEVEEGKVQKYEKIV